MKCMGIPHGTSRIKSCKGTAMWHRKRDGALNQLPTKTGRAFKRHKDAKLWFSKVSWSSLEYWVGKSSLSSNQLSCRGHCSPQSIDTIYPKTLLSICKHHSILLRIARGKNNNSFSDFNCFFHLTPSSSQNLSVRR